MAEEQLPLFQRKTFPAKITQGAVVKVPTPESTILAVVPAYYTYLQSQGYSKYTPGDFRGDVNKLGTFLKHKTLQEITKQDIRQWVSELRTKEHMTDKSISRKLTAITNFFTWLQSEKILTDNPALSIPNRKITSPLPEILFEDECTRLLAAASADPRTYLLVLLLLETGMKTEEVMELQLSHVDTSNTYSPEVWIKHSGKKQWKTRKLKLPREITEVLTEYTENYHPTDRLFPYTQRTLQYLLRTAGEQAKITKQVSAQLLRDTCAVRLLKAGEPMEKVLRKLGLSEKTWEDAEEKYQRLISKAL